MAVSRRLRYEILRRDDHTCRYCGSAAPDVKLTVDHVLPVALGGGDDASNLVTACADCNAGKSSSAPDAPIVEGVSDDALRWAAAITRAAELQAAKVEERQVYLHRFRHRWENFTPDYCRVQLPEDWQITVGRFFDSGLELHALLPIIDDVLPRGYLAFDKVWPYFCTVVRNHLAERQEIAARLIAEGQA